MRCDLEEAEKKETRRKNEYLVPRTITSNCKSQTYIYFFYVAAAALMTSVNGILSTPKAVATGLRLPYTLCALAF